MSRTRRKPEPSRAAFRAHAPLGEALALDPGGAGLIAAARRGKQPSPQAFGFFFDMPGPLRFVPEAYTDEYGNEVPSSIHDGIAILCLDGPIEKRDSRWCHSYEALAREVERALECPEVKAVVLKIDSPGGVAAGMGETHKAIRRLRKEHGKPVIAFVDEMACSAAYHLASACDEIWTTEAGHLGSIGVILCTVDETAALEKAGISVRYVVTGSRKADLHPGQPVTDEVLAVAQAKVDALGQQFFQAVGRSRGDRGLTAEKAESLQAAVFLGKDAVSEGLADGVASWTKFLDFLRSSIGATSPEGRTFSVTPSSAKAKAKAMANQTPLQAAAAAKADEKQKGALAAAFSTIAAALGIGGDTKPSAKMKKVTEKYSEKRERMEEDDEPSDADMEEEEEEEAMDSSTDKSEPDSTSAEAEEEEEEAEAKGKAKGAAEEEEEKAVSRATSRAWKAAMAAYQAEALKGPHASAVLLRSPDRLRREARRATGSANLDGAMTALSRLRTKQAAEGAAALTKQADLEARTSKLETDSRRDRVTALVAQAKKEGRAGATTKDGRAMLRQYGMEHGTKKLSAFLAAQPKIVRTAEEDVLVPGGDENVPGGNAPSRDAQTEQMLTTMTAGMTPDQAKAYREDFAKRLTANVNGAARAPRI